MRRASEAVEIVPTERDLKAPWPPKPRRKQKKGVFTLAKQQIYLEALRRGLRKGEAAQEAGVSRDVVWRFRKKHPEFDAEAELAEWTAIETIEDVLYTKALEGDMEAIKMVLYNRAPERWSSRQQIAHQITGRDGRPIELTTVAQRLRDQLLAEAAGLAQAVPAVTPNGSDSTGPRLATDSQT